MKKLLIILFYFLGIVNATYSQKVDTIKGTKAYITEEVIRASHERRARNGNITSNTSSKDQLNRTSSQSLNSFQSYFIYGPNPVGVGTIQTYYVAPATLGGFWSVTCATILDFYDDYVTVLFSESCSSATITYYAPDLQFTEFIVTINSSNPLSAGTITTGSQIITYNTKPVNINATTASGGTCGSYSYQWQSSTNNVSFSNIPGATSQNLSFASLSALTQTTYYRRKVNCGTAEQFTGSVMVQVKPPLGSGTISSSSQTINYNTIPATITASAATGGNCTNYTYYWQRSADNVIYENIPGANGQNLTFTTGQKEKWYYRRHVVCGTETAHTNTVFVNVIHVSGELADLNRNWTISKLFDENGNLVTADKVYYGSDGLVLQNQQFVKHRKKNGELANYVFANQPFLDVYGRVVGSTLSAPISGESFLYSPNFVRNSSGNAYDHRNFDIYSTVDKTNNPDPVGGQSVLGTLGWYYGPNNTIEPYTAQTDYPYFRQSYYSDGSGMVKKSADVGETFKMGTGHEVASYQSKVVNELDDYLRIRNKYFTSSEIGSLPTNLSGMAVQVVNRNPDGKETVVIQDKGGNVLMTARVGNELTVNNTGIKVGGTLFRYEFSGVGSGGEYVSNLVIQSIFTTTAPNIKVYKNDGNGYKLFYDGIASSFVSPTSIREYILIESNSDFNVTYSAFNSGIGSQVVCSGCVAKQDVQYSSAGYFFKLLSSSIVSITGGSFQIYDMSGNEQLISFSSGGNLSAGYYKIVPTSANPVYLSYTNKFSDVSYYFYNQIGQLVGTLAPEGVKKLYGTGINNYATRALVPFFVYNEYNEMGQLTRSISTENGTTEYIYRQDGKVRFTQDAVQKLNGRYSYVNYDSYGRITESGEYHPDAGGVAFNSDMSAVTNPLRNILENTSASGGLTTGTKNDVLLIYYDKIDPNFSLSGYLQDLLYMGGKISFTKKYSKIINNSPLATNLISANWYNFDEEGKVVWSVKFINGLGYKTYDLTYDFQNRLVKSVFQKNVASETFVHFFEYDQSTSNLSKVYTNTENNELTKTLQASYLYFVHGPLKRIEIGNNLQGIDYSYTLDGSLKAINNSNKLNDPGGDANDAFGMVLDYFTNDYINNKVGTQLLKGVNASGIVNDSYVSQVKAMTWFTKKPSSIQGIPGIEDPVTNVYVYDEKYNFKENIYGTSINFTNTPATFTQSLAFKEKIVDPATAAPGYDANGNITYLQRTNESGVLVDNFKYNYVPNTNRLSSVLNQVNSQNYATYSYNALGQLINESSSYSGNNSKFIRYNSLGKVEAVARDASFTQLVVEYLYDENGTRIIKKSYNSQFQIQQISYYVGGVVYTQNGQAAPIIPQEYPIDGGSGRIGVYFKPGNIYAYELADHLGNVRSVVARNINTLEVRQYNDFYSYGMVARQAGTNDYRYGFQGQFSEKENETNWNSFELRMYDSRIGRWLSNDPYNQYHSPFVGMGNDPINGIDPDGGFRTRPGAWLANFFFGFGGEIVKNGDEYNINVPYGNSGVLSIIDGSHARYVSNQLNKKKENNDLLWDVIRVHDSKLINRMNPENRLAPGTGSHLYKMGDGSYRWGFSGQVELSPVDPSDVVAVGAVASGLIVKGVTRAVVTKGAGALAGETIAARGFVSMMDPGEAARYAKYWQNYSPKQISPGTTRLNWTRVSGRTGRMENSRVIYDNYGRQIYRVDLSDHMRPNIHSNPHLHTYEYGEMSTFGKESVTNF